VFLHNTINGFHAIRDIGRRLDSTLSLVLPKSQQFVREIQDLLFDRRGRTIERNC
jgi:hypothetical protein